MAAQLVPLPEVERLSPTVIRILGGNPGKFTLQGTNTYIVGKGKNRVLIDTGEGKPSWAAAVDRTLREEGASISHVILTHWHPDHTGGIDQLLALCPDALIFKHQPSDDGHQQDIPDGQQFLTEGASLLAVHTPGHTTDHVALLLPEEDAMFTGDNVLGQGTAVFEDLGVYLSSLHRMKPLFGGRAFPGHGPVVEDGPAKISEYITHRQEREDQVIQTLRAASKAGGTALSASGASGVLGASGAEAGLGTEKGPSLTTSSPTGGDGSMTAMELVKIIYRDVREDLHAAAERGVLQILRKLQQEDRVLADGIGWRLKSRSPL